MLVIKHKENNMGTYRTAGDTFLRNTISGVHNADSGEICVHNADFGLKPCAHNADLMAPGGRDAGLSFFCPVRVTFGLFCFCVCAPTPGFEEVSRVAGEETMFS